MGIQFGSSVKNVLSRFIDITTTAILTQISRTRLVPLIGRIDVTDFFIIINR